MLQSFSSLQYHVIETIVSHIVHAVTIPLILKVKVIITMPSLQIIHIVFVKFLSFSFFFSFSFHFIFFFFCNNSKLTIVAVVLYNFLWFWPF